MMISSHVMLNWWHIPLAICTNHYFWTTQFLWQKLNKAPIAYTILEIVVGYCPADVLTIASYEVALVPWQDNDYSSNIK